MTIIVTIFIVSIITEHMVIKRLQMSPGVEIKNGRCRLKEGYGPLAQQTENPTQNPTQGLMTFPEQISEIHNDWYRPFVN